MKHHRHIHVDVLSMTRWKGCKCNICGIDIFVLKHTLVRLRHVGVKYLTKALHTYLLFFHECFHLNESKTLQ